MARPRFVKSTKKRLHFRNKKMTIWKLNLKSINKHNGNSYCGKNWRATKIKLIIVTVIKEMIVKRIVMILNEDK